MDTAQWQIRSAARMKFFWKTHRLRQAKQRRLRSGLAAPSLSGRQPAGMGTPLRSSARGAPGRLRAAGWGPVASACTVNTRRVHAEGAQAAWRGESAKPGRVSAAVVAVANAARRARMAGPPSQSSPAAAVCQPTSSKSNACSVGQRQHSGTAGEHARTAGRSEKKIS